VVLILAALVSSQWTKSFKLADADLTVKIVSKSGEPYSVLVSDHGKIRGSVASEIYFDNSVRPFLRVDGQSAFLAVAGVPGAGSGQYVNVFRISEKGKAVKQIGQFLYGDLSRWFKTGIVTEWRPAKYATDDILRIYPKLFDDSKFMDKAFVVTYRFDGKAFKYSGIKVVPLDLNRPDHVKMPK